MGGRGTALIVVHNLEIKVKKQSCASVIVTKYDNKNIRKKKITGTDRQYLNQQVGVSVSHLLLSGTNPNNGIIIPVGKMSTKNPPIRGSVGDLPAVPDPSHAGLDTGWGC